MSEIDSFFCFKKSACQVDVRSKIFVLFAISIAIFFVDLKGLTLLFVLFFSLVAVDGFVEFKDRPSEFATVIKAVLKIAFPLYIICIISFLANAIILSGDASGIVGGFEGEDITKTYNLKSTTLVARDGIQVTPESASRGVFYCGRILLLGWSSLYVANTVSLIEFSNAFKWFFWPLTRLKVPVSDASLAVSIALRFIPEIFIEFQNIREAQWCRGAKMASGGIITRTRANAGCFVPLIVRCMANVEDLSEALTARCWGIYETSPKDELDKIPVSQILFLIIVSFLLLAIVALV